MFKPKLGQQRQLCSPSVASGFGVSLSCLGLSKACPWSPAGSEVTLGYVETTLVKCHGNENRADTPHRAQRQGERVPGDESADLGRETGGRGQEHREGRKGRGHGQPSGSSLSL